MTMRKRNRIHQLLVGPALLGFFACQTHPDPGPGDTDTDDGDGGSNSTEDTESAGDGDGDGDGPTGGMVDDQGSGGEATEQPLELLTQYPAPEDTQANALVPLVFTFSEPLDPESAEDAFSLTQGGQELSLDLEVDGPTVRLRLNEIPMLPARINVVVQKTLRSLDGAAYIGDSWSFSYPLWQTPSGDLPPSDAPVAFADLGGGDLLLVGAREGQGWARLQQDETWVDLPAPSTAAMTPLAALSTSEGPMVVWLEDQQIAAAVLQENQWLKVPGNLPAPTGAELSVGQTPDARPLIACADDAELTVYEFDQGTFHALPSAPLSEDALELSVTATVDGPFVAWVNAEYDLEVLGWDGAAWEPLGAGIDRERVTGPVHPQLRGAEELFLAYLDGDELSNNVQIASFDEEWQAAGPALDLVLDGETNLPSMELVDGAPVVAWVEKEIGPRQLLVARAEGAGFRILGQAAMTGVPSDVSQLILAVNEQGFPSVALHAEDTIELRRFNGSPSLPYALSDRGDREDCEIPEDGPDFPTTLSATGCYQDIKAGTLVSGAIPYNINSALWTDDAKKHRFIVVPEGTTVGYKETGALTFPVGSILIKEFLVEKVTGNPDSVATMETRFLVKRCEADPTTCDMPWQGYSYEWNDEGTEAALLTHEGSEAHYKEWAITDDGVPGTHTHEYPSRTQCLQCHLSAVGSVNGPQAPQLNRPQAYGNLIDNQLRTWQHIGLFDDAVPSNAPEDRPRIPAPADVGEPLEERAAGYFHSNCAHCHQPNGARPSTDFNYFGAGIESLVCKPVPGRVGEIYFIPQDPDLSFVVQRVSARQGDANPPGLQMPPLGTLITDSRQISVLKAWINALPGNCD